MRWWIFALVVSCGKPSTPAAVGSGSAGSVPVVLPPASDAAQATKPALTADKLAIDPSPYTGVDIAFDNHVPLLPAISPDGAKIAMFASDALGPEPVQPWHFEIDNLANAAELERLELIDDKLADKLATATENDTNTKPPADIVAPLHARAAAITKKLRDGGYASLVRVDAGADMDRQSAKLGDLMFTSQKPDDVLEIKVADASGKVLHRERIANFNQGEADYGGEKGSCYYRPNTAEVLRDADSRHLYLIIRSWHNEMCGALPDRYLVWDLPAPDPEIEAVTKLVHGQFDASWRPGDAQLVSTTGLVADVKTFGPGGDHVDADVAVTLARDGKTTWATATTKRGDVALRASDVAIKTAAGWQLAAAAWTRPIDNADVNRDAKAGKLTRPVFAGDPGDASLRAAFAKLASDGLDATATKRADLVAIGSGPGERTVGPVFGKAWKAAWKGHVTIASSIARVAPSGTTGWVAARIELAKPGYKIPFFAFAVFDKTGAGEWSLVHIHFGA